MAQPPRYVREKNFTSEFGHETDHSALNAELDRASNSINDIRFNLAILQADDGRLRPDVVTFDSVNPDVYQGIVSQAERLVQENLERANAVADRVEAAAAGIDIERAEAAGEQLRADAAAAAASAAAALSSQQSAAISMEAAAGAAIRAAESAALATLGSLSADAGGTVNAITAVFEQAVVEPLRDHTVFFVRATGANTESGVVFKPGAANLLDLVRPDGTALKVGDIPSAGFEMMIQFNAPLGRYVLLNPFVADGASGVPVGTIDRFPVHRDGWLELSLSTMTYAPLSVFSGLLDMWVGEDANDTAECFFRCNVDGTVRSATGTYIALPSELQWEGRYVVETGSAGGSSWEIYNDGWIRQRGLISTTAAQATVSLAKPYANNNYIVTAVDTTSAAASAHTGVFSLSASQIVFNKAATSAIIFWKAEGYAANPPTRNSILQIKAFGAAVNQGTADIAGLANQLQDALSQMPVSTVIDAGTVSASRRLVFDNPYEGYYVSCEAQIQVGGKWGNPEFAQYYSGGWASYGAKANQLLPDNTVVLQTGTSGVRLEDDRLQGAPFGGVSQTGLLSAPCRIIVTRLGRINP